MHFYTATRDGFYKRRIRAGATCRSSKPIKASWLEPIELPKGKEARDALVEEMMEYAIPLDNDPSSKPKTGAATAEPSRTKKVATSSEAEIK